MTPTERLRARIDALETEGERLAGEGDYEAAYMRARVALEMWRLLAADPPLPRGEQGSRVNKMDSQAHAFRTSQGRSKDPLVQAANGARMTLRELADKVGMKAGHLSMARRGERTIRESAALKIEELTGFKAAKANWPAGIVKGK